MARTEVPVRPAGPAIGTAAPTDPTNARRNRADSGITERHRRGRLADTHPVARRGGRAEGRIVFTVVLAVYVTVGAVLVFGMHSVVGDALSRVANAYYVVYSRDPHLAAVGFVWNPLPSLATIPLLPLKVFWPSLVSVGFAGNLVSAAAMAASVAVLCGMLGDLGLSRPTRLVATALYALHPMVVYYGANGMSEAMLLLFLLLTARYLARYLRTGSTGALVGTGVALGFAYLTRYEAVAAGAAVAVVVAGSAFVRSTGTRRVRVQHAFADVAVASAPLVATVTAWALASWIIVKHPFETFSSVYGNSSQVRLAAGGIRAVGGATATARLHYNGRQLLGLEPLLPLVVVAAVVVMWRRRDARPLAAAAVFGSVLAFQALVFAKATSFGWLRFQITVIPLAVCLAAAGIEAARRRWTAVVVYPVLLASVAVALPVSASVMRDPILAREESYRLVARHVKGRVIPRPRGFVTEREVARYLDGLHLPRASVLVDVATGFPIVLASRRPQQFVITPDRDFDAVVSDPAGAGVRYLLTIPRTGLGSNDALNLAYPSLYETGAGIAHVVRAYPHPAEDSFPWRIYRINTSPER